MARYLIVAHKSLGGERLLSEVRSRHDRGDAQFHLLVPVTHPGDHAWSDEECEATARKVLDRALDRFEDLGVKATGEVGDANPVYAVDTVLQRGEHFDEIILSTLPPGISRWLKLDVHTRVSNAVPMPVTHVIGGREPTG